MKRRFLPPPDFLRDTPVFEGRRKLISHCIDRIRDVPGDLVEFGTYEGLIAGWILKYMGDDPRSLYLCDSWEGLPEDWGRGDDVIRLKGHFACEPPELHDERAVIVRGWFEETAAALREMADAFAFVHIDCDLYSSAKTALRTVKDRLPKGAIILFDELWGYETWRDHEFKALGESGITGIWIGRTHKGQSALMVTG